MNPKDFTDLKKYKIINKLGEGSFGTVYKVQDIETQKIYAAKVSSKVITRRAKATDEILHLFREVKIMSALNHPSIIQYVGYNPKDFDKKTKPTIIFEYAINGTLKSIIEFKNTEKSTDKWDDTKKLICIYGIASGMAYLHENNIIHRDLKTENILMDDFLCPKISDFGLSKVNDAISKSLRINSISAFKGTPAYCSPEGFEDNQFTKAGDVYSFAMIVYEVMSGLAPFQGKNLDLISLVSKITNGERPKLTSDIPDAYQKLIEKCWLHNPLERPTFEEIVFVLKNNHEFITEKVDEEDFHAYVEFIDNYKTSFDLSRKSFHLEDFIKNKKTKLKRMSIRVEKNKIVEIFPDIADQNINGTQAEQVKEADSLLINKMNESDEKENKMNDSNEKVSKMNDSNEKENKMNESDENKMPLKNKVGSTREKSGYSNNKKISDEFNSKNRKSLKNKFGSDSDDYFSKSIQKTSQKETKIQVKKKFDSNSYNSESVGFKPVNKKAANKSRLTFSDSDSDDLKQKDKKLNKNHPKKVFESSSDHFTTQNKKVKKNTSESDEDRKSVV